MKWDKTMGTVTGVTACERNGRVGIRFTIEFYDGHHPDIALVTIANQSPVKIIECDTSEIKPHVYMPSAMHMGDCNICGHLQGAAIHIAPRPYAPRPGRGPDEEDAAGNEEGA